MTLALKTRGGHRRGGLAWSFFQLLVLGSVVTVTSKDDVQGQSADGNSGFINSSGNPITSNRTLHLRRKERQKIKWKDPKTVSYRQGFVENPTLEDEDDITWWHNYVDVLARPYNISHDKSWCRSSKRKSGLYYIKTPKTASSTAAAVTLQIAINVADRELSSPKPCNSRAEHWYDYSRIKEPSLVWTTLREPISHELSSYYFTVVSRGKRRATPNNQWRTFRNAKNFQIKYVSRFHPGRMKKLRRFTWRGFGTTKYDPVDDATNSQVVEIINEVMSTYHFIGLAERMDESLVVMKLLFGLEDEDIVVLGVNKHAGGFDDGQSKGQCVRIEKGGLFPSVVDYVAHDFRVQNHDFFLHAVANRSLDMTIDKLGGQGRVQEEIDKLKMMQELVKKHCEATTVFPCTEEGPPNILSKQSCFYGDVGCGHECVQVTLRKYREGVRKMEL